MPVIAQPSEVLAAGTAEDRDMILSLLTRAYWMELETVVNYLANSINPDGVRASHVSAALAGDIDEELGHARRLGERIKELHGTVPGSLEFVAEQAAMQPPEHATDVVSVIKGVIRTETEAIDHYRQIVHQTDQIDPVTQDMTLAILHDEERHRRQFEGFLAEYESGDLQ